MFRRFRLVTSAATAFLDPLQSNHRLNATGIQDSARLRCPVPEALPIPPEVCHRCSGRVGDYVQDIACGLVHDTRANYFKQHGPAGEMRDDFPRARRRVLLSPAKPGMKAQQYRQRTRDEQRVIEPGMDERTVEIRFHHPSIHHVERATRQEQRVAPVTERSHNNARMISPKPAPSATFRRSNIICED